MTGFGSGRAQSGGEDISAEIRSVNHKFCEVKPRLPRELSLLEPELVKWVKDRVARGGIEVTVRRAGEKSAVIPKVDLALAREYAEAYKVIEQSLGLEGKVPLDVLLGAEGVIRLEERAPDLEAARTALGAAMTEAMRQLLEMREREGEALARDLSARLDAIEALTRKLDLTGPQVVEAYRVRLAERVKELGRGLELDPARLAQEVALFAERSDVAEELTRLRSHLEQFRGLVKSGEPAGRKMDFLVQEMNREVNTTGSKSQGAELTVSVVEMKAELERMREQVQNVE